MHRFTINKNQPIVRILEILAEYIPNIKILSNLICNLTNYTTEFEQSVIIENHNLATQSQQ